MTIFTIHSASYSFTILLFFRSKFLENLSLSHTIWLLLSYFIPFQKSFQHHPSFIPLSMSSQPLQIFTNQIFIISPSPKNFKVLLFQCFLDISFVVLFGFVLIVYILVNLLYPMLPILTLISSILLFRVSFYPISDRSTIIISSFYTISTFH